MAEFIDSNELLFTSFEPKLKFRYLMQIDGIPAYMIKATARPQFESTVIEIPHINNMRRVKGRTKWSGSVDLTLYDPIAPSGAQIVMSWALLHHEDLTGRDGYGDFYKKDCDILVTGPSGDIVEKWTYKNAWISNTNFGSLGYEEDSITDITMTLTYDYALLSY